MIGNPTDKTNSKNHSSLDSKIFFEFHKNICEKIEKFENRTWICEKGSKISKAEEIDEIYRIAEIKTYPVETKISMRMYDKNIGIRIRPSKNSGIGVFDVDERPAAMMWIDLYEVAASHGELIHKTEVDIYRDSGGIIFWLGLSRNGEHKKNVLGKLDYYCHNKPLIEIRHNKPKGTYKVYRPNALSFEDKYEGERTHTFPRIVLTHKYMIDFIEKLEIKLINPKHDIEASSQGICKHCTANFQTYDSKLLDLLKTTST